MMRPEYAANRIVNLWSELARRLQERRDAMTRAIHEQEEELYLSVPMEQREHAKQLVRERLRGFRSVHITVAAPPSEDE